MEISDDILCLFSAEISTRDGSYVIEVPEQELTLGEAETEVPYRIAIIPQTATQSDAESTQQPSQSEDQSDPPVSEGDHRTVEIEDIGEQGDGIAHVERGYLWRSSVGTDR